MKKKQIQNVNVHIVKGEHAFPFNKINQLHVEVIEHNLKKTNLTYQQKITVIDKIIKNMKLRENSGLIK